MRLLMVSLAAMLSTQASAATFSEARSAYDQNRVAEAERLYAELIADAKATSLDRSAAARELARIAWLVDRDIKRALSHLDKARGIGDKPCDTAAMTARFLREAKLYADAINRSAALLQGCPEASKRDGIRMHLIGSRLDLAATNPAGRAQLLADASSEAALFTPEAGIGSARVRLETALLTGQAAAALAAWKDYFWLDETDAPQALEGRGVTAIFNNGLRAQATLDDRLQLTELLMRTGFAEASRRFAAVHGLQAAAAGSPTWKRLEAYWGEREKLEAVLLRVNRDLARGRRDDKAIEVALKAFVTALITASGASGDPRVALKRGYGLVGTGAGITNGYPSMHAGHVIEDRDDSVTQYGQTAKIHFMAIDNLISNGFTSWLWDGSAAVGGWTADDVIVHVRSEYVQGPLSAYLNATDPAARNELIKQERELSREDSAKLKRAAVATLPGLSSRLQLQLIDRIAATAKAKSAAPSNFRRAFLAEYSRANLDQSIDKHEGRHAIDEVLKHAGTVDQSVLEYRAKLSELALAEYPRMALINMNRALEGDGPHDKAGAKVFDDYRKWMETHTDQIVGYDPAIPVLVQLDKLTDSQIREIARGLDPLARGDVTAPPKL